MAQGDFTKEEADEMLKAVAELFDAISKSKRPAFIGHLNDISLFLERAGREADAKKK
jgi:hypothetical protein